MWKTGGIAQSAMLISQSCISRHLPARRGPDGRNTLVRPPCHPAAYTMTSARSRRVWRHRRSVHDLKHHAQLTSRTSTGTHSSAESAQGQSLGPASVLHLASNRPAVRHRAYVPA
jgi:hypothetical protein